LPSGRTRLVAAFALVVVGTSTNAQPSYAAPRHPTVSLQAGFVGFYPGHLVLDAIGGAYLDDGVLHVHADRIILDMRGEHYLAAGSVTVEGQSLAHGDALGVDIVTHRGVLVDSASSPSSMAVDGAAVGGPAIIAPNTEPLALPDVGFEQPYVRATRAVAHLGADVRLRNARIIVPGGESVALPSYVYTYATSPGYSISNINTNGEDLPIYFGSTADSIQGVHFSYNTVTKVAIGLDSHFVGERSYVLASGSPLIGPTKVFNFTWQDYINDHASQTFNSSTVTGSGTFNAYDIRNSIHRSFLELTASTQPDFHGSTFAWQSFDQPFGSSTISRPFYHLRSEYGFSHVSQQGSFAPFAADAVLPNTVWHSAFEGYLGSPSWNFGQNTSLFGSADLRKETDTLPHRQVLQDYTLTLYTRLTRAVSTNLSDSVVPFFDAYPSVATIYHSRSYQQTISVNYDNGDPFALNLFATHSTATTDNPNGSFAIPWSLFGTLRFRVTRSLSLQLSRSYFFGYNGQRFGALGLQILP